MLDSRLLNLGLFSVHSGFFDIKTAWEKKLRFGLGTDVGAGTSFCHLQTLNEAYKVILNPMQHCCLADSRALTNRCTFHRVFVLARASNKLALIPWRFHCWAQIARMQGVKLDALNSFYMATLGSAASLSLDDRIGNFKPGKEADFLLLDREATPLLKHRMGTCTSLAEELFVLMTIGDDRVVAETYVAGNCVHKK